MQSPPVDYKILIVDDDKSNRQILTLILSGIGEIILAKNGTQAIQKSRQLQPDIILLDIIMPDTDGYDVMNTLKTDERTQSIPIVVVSSSVSPETEERVLLNGASDFIAKPFHAGVVQARVKAHLKNMSQARMVEKTSQIDPLTGIANHAQLGHLFNKVKQKSPVNSHVLVGLVEIYEFESYNHKFGALASERLLRLVSHALAGRLMMENGYLIRVYDAVFAFLMQCHSNQKAHDFFNSGLKSVRLLNIPKDDGQKYYVSICIGAGCYPLETHTDVYHLIRLSRHTLEQSKSKGPNQYVFSPSLQEN